MIAGSMIYTVCTTHHAYLCLDSSDEPQLRRFMTLRKDSNLLINRVIKLVIETGCVTGMVVAFNSILCCVYTLRLIIL